MLKKWREEVPLNGITKKIRKYNSQKQKYTPVVVEMSDGKFLNTSKSGDVRRAAQSPTFGTEQELEDSENLFKVQKKVSEPSRRQTSFEDSELIKNALKPIL
jgi:hypothetical protein